MKHLLSLPFSLCIQASTKLPMSVKVDSNSLARPSSKKHSPAFWRHSPGTISTMWCVASFLSIFHLGNDGFLLQDFFFEFRTSSFQLLHFCYSHFRRLFGSLCYVAFASGEIGGVGGCLVLCCVGNPIGLWVRCATCTREIYLANLTLGSSE